MLQQGVKLEFECRGSSYFEGWQWHIKECSGLDLAGYIAVGFGVDIDSSIASSLITRAHGAKCGGPVPAEF